MKVAGLIDNLFFSSKLNEVARSLGAESVICTTVEAIPPDVSRIFVDLSAGFDAIAEILKIKATHSAPVTAFFSHVQIDMKERAELAGADEVLPRSAFAARLAEIIRN